MQKALSFGPWPPLGYVGNSLDRAAGRRADARFLDACAAHEACGFYLVGGEMIVLKRTGDGFDPLFAPHELAAHGTGGERIFLGLQHGDARFGLAEVPELVTVEGHIDVELGIEGNEGFEVHLAVVAKMLDGVEVDVAWKSAEPSGKRAGPKMATGRTP